MRRFPSPRAALAAAAVVPLVVGVTAAEAGTSGAHADSTPAVTAAHLRLSVTTTSDWTQLHIRTGQIVAQHVTSQNGTGSVQTLSDGVGLGGVQGTTTVVTDLVLSETAGASSVNVEIDKGYFGSTTVSLTNLNGTPYGIGTVTDDVHNVLDPSNRRYAAAPRSVVFSSTPLALPHADSRHLVLAFYYPWYADYSDPKLADTPTDPRSVWSGSGVLSMTQQARAAGVDGFVVSWSGDKNNGSAFDDALHAAEQTHGYVTPYIEVPDSADLLGHAQVSVVRDWIEQALTRASSPAFLKTTDGTPVVFVYGMGHLLPRHWKAILDDLASRGETVKLVGDETDAGYTPYEWGVHRYAVNDSPSSLASWSQATGLAARAGAVVDPSQAPELFAGTVSPGFDDQKLRGTQNPVVPRDGSNRYDATWDAALTGAPDWVLVTSWNEWYEDTEIEPGNSTGGDALSTTGVRSQAFKSGS